MRGSSFAGTTTNDVNAQIEAIGRAVPSEPYPSTEAGWRERYFSLQRAYEHGEYGDGEVKAAHLWAARGDDGKVIDIARRLFGFFRFICDVDARALIGPKGLTLEVEGADDAALLAKGEAVWRRSRLKQAVRRWARLTAVCGDFYVEAVRDSATAPFRTRMVGYPADWVTPQYDDTGERLISVEIAFVYMETPAANTPALRSAVQHSYRRVIDAERVTVYVDDKVVSSQPHYVGRAPVVHMMWAPWIAPEHSLPAAHGLDAAVARLDSFAAQMGAVANRYADPKTVVTGATVGAGGDLGAFGRIISAPNPDAKVAYLETAATAVGPLLDVMREIMAHIRETAPEFLFADATATESGTARAYKAAALEMKIGEVRGHWFAALAEITGIAVAMDDNAIYDPERYPFDIDAAPFIQPDVDAVVQTLVSASPYLLKRDVVRKLQAIGLADDDMSVDDYVTALMDEVSRAAGPTLDTGADPAADDTGNLPG